MPAIRFDDAAVLDVRFARDWYESEQPGLGERFVDAVEASVARLSAFPDSGYLVHRDVRRILVERFPYVVYYRHSASECVVLACLHVARDPEYSIRRLSG